MIISILSYLGLSAITAKIRLFIYGGIAAAGILAITGAYLKGRYDCAAATELATAKAVIEKQEREIATIMEQLQLSKRQSQDFEETEASNEAISPDLEAPSRTACGLDSEWLRDLSKLR